MHNWKPGRGERSSNKRQEQNRAGACVTTDLTLMMKRYETAQKGGPGMKVGCKAAWSMQQAKAA